MKKINEKGFTLLELTLSITITTIVMGIVFSTFLAINKSFANRQIQNEQRQIIEILEQLLNDELRYVDNIKIEDKGIGSYSKKTYSQDGKVYIDDNKPLEDGIYGNNWATLVFSKGDKDVLDIEIKIKEPNSEVETKETISIKLLNVSIKSTIEQQESNVGKNNISYKKY